MSSQFKFNWSQFEFLNLILNCIKKKNRGTSSIQLNFLIHQLTVYFIVLPLLFCQKNPCYPTHPLTWISLIIQSFLSIQYIPLSILCTTFTNCTAWIVCFAYNKILLHNCEGIDDTFFFQYSASLYQFLCTTKEKHIYYALAEWRRFLRRLGNVLKFWAKMEEVDSSYCMYNVICAVWKRVPFTNSTVWIYFFAFNEILLHNYEL
jgi:hypothetical protein